jgi:HPt (histidine-containing phosphotransfer) domain-containing protein
MITAPELNPICDNIHEIKLTSAESYFITKVLNILNVVLDSKAIDHNLYTKYNKLVSHDGTLAEKINSLKELQKELERKFPQEFSKNKTVTRTNVTSDIQLLHDAVVEAIHRMSGGASFENLAEISSTGLDFNNSIRLANSIFKRNDINVTSGGVSLVGFMQGIDFASPYANPSEAVRELAQAHSYSVT